MFIIRDVFCILGLKILNLLCIFVSSQNYYVESALVRLILYLF
jgi:hypothetical protein